MDRPRLDRFALGGIVSTSLVLVAVASVTTWRVVTGEAGDMSPVDWFVYALFAVVAVVLTVAVVFHLRPAVRLRLTPEGISTGRASIRWSDVHRIERPGFGVLLVQGPNAQLRLPTYLFEGRADLEARIESAARTPLAEDPPR